MVIFFGFWDEYLWRSEFIEVFVRYNKEGRRMKCVVDVFEVSVVFLCIFMYFISKFLIDWGGCVFFEYVVCV